MRTKPHSRFNDHDIGHLQACVACADGHHWIERPRRYPLFHSGADSAHVERWCQPYCADSTHRHFARTLPDEKTQAYAAEPADAPPAKKCAACGAAFRLVRGNSPIDTTMVCECEPRTLLAQRGVMPDDVAASVLRAADDQIAVAILGKGVADFLNDQVIRDHHLLWDRAPLDNFPRHFAPVAFADVPTDPYRELADHNREWARVALRSIPEWAYRRPYEAAVLAVAELATVESRRAPADLIDQINAALRAAWRAR